MKKKLLAEYVNKLSELLKNTSEAADRPLYERYLADAASMLAKLELEMPLTNEIELHERLLGHTWMQSSKDHSLLYEKWESFKKQ